MASEKMREVAAGQMLGFVGSSALEGLDFLLSVQ